MTQDGAMPTDPTAGVPRSFDEIIGQAQAAGRLKTLAELAKLKGSAAPHILLIGPDGIGKRTLAGVFAREVGAVLSDTAAQEMPRGGDLLGVLSNLNENDVLLIRDIHRCSNTIVDLLNEPLRQFAVDFVTEKGLHARKIRHRSRGSHASGLLKASGTFLRPSGHSSR